MLLQRDHPRVCGKNRNLQCIGVYTMGSPPRVREKLKDPSTRMQWNRITPACAGKTYINRDLPVERRDHPRVCGKNFGKAMIGLLSVGSPPRVREKHNIINSIGCALGITPACAGKTPCSACFADSIRDHPRVCGKNRRIY